MYPFLCPYLKRVLGALAVTLLIAAPELAAQTGTIAGRVTDSQTGQPLAAAQVFIPELELGALSRQNGSYLLLNVPAGARQVTVQLIGYRSISTTVDVTAGETAVRDFQLTQEALSLDEIIVTGTPAGTQRRAIGNTVQRLSVPEVTQAVALSNFQDLLSTRTPGLRLSVQSGNIGTGSQMTLRGVGSFNLSRNQPLIYVDGVRVNNNTTAGPTLGDGDGGVSVLNDFNPDEIESVEIIKGPAAASLYGSEASAGVIQIITKKGAEGAPEFSMSVRQGANFVTDPAGRLGTMWTCPTSPAPNRNHCPNESDLVPYNMYDEGTRYIREGYFDWPTKNLFSNGHSQAYNLDVRGGTPAVRYFLSGNYSDDVGIVKFNTQEMLRFRGNVNVLFHENLTLDVSSSYVSGDTRFDQATVSDGGIWQDLLWSNGYYLDRVTPFDKPGANPRLGGFQEHLPSDVANQTFATREFDRFTGSATLNHTLRNLDLGPFGTGSITQRLVLGIDKSWDINTNFFPKETGIVPEHLQKYLRKWESVYTETVDGEMTYSRPITTSSSADYSLTARLAVNPTWTFDTSVGFQYYLNQRDIFTNRGQGFASTLSRTINQIAQSRLSTTYEFIEDKSRGFYVQEQVGWNDRLFLTGAVRFDESSTFGAEAPAATYPKVSGTWVISEESFWNFDAINLLRLRGAWGQAGRQPSAIAGFNIYQAVPGPGGAPAIRPSSPGNPGIEPEVSTEIEFGFDYALLDDRFSGEFTYYRRKNEGMLLGIAIPSSFGFPGSVDQNAGRIDNWGWEARLSTRVLQTDPFSFDLDLTADFNDNKIMSLGEYPGSATIRAGLPYPFHVQFDRVVDAEFMDAADKRKHTTTNVFGQRVYATCDPGISLAPDPNAADAGKYGRVRGGQPVPCTEVRRGLNLFAGRAFAPYAFSVAPRVSLLGGRLQVFATAEGQYGRWNHDNGHAWGHIYNNTKVSRLEDDPYWVASDRLNGNRASIEKSLYKADFWKLREVAAMYTLPQSLVQRTGADRASLSFSARNIWTIWRAQKEIFDNPIIDPEYGNTTNLTGANNFWSSPALSSVSATLRVTF